MGFDHEEYEFFVKIGDDFVPLTIHTTLEGTGCDDWEDEEQEEKSELDESAEKLFETYQSFIKAGFNTNQAFALLKLIMNKTER